MRCLYRFAAIAPFTPFGLSDIEHWLIVTLHEIGADRHSVRLVLRSCRCYNGAAVQNKPPQLPPVCPERTRHGLQRVKTSAALHKQHLEFWKKQLADAPSCWIYLRIVRGLRRATMPGVSFLYYPARIKWCSCSPCRGRTGYRHWGFSLCAFSHCFNRYTGSQDVIIGLPVPSGPR
jgi:hypothetical protein